MHRFGDAADWAAYRNVAPAGKVPCLVDGDVVVWDSLSIVEYLGESHPLCVACRRDRTSLGLQCRGRNAFWLSGLCASTAPCIAAGVCACTKCPTVWFAMSNAFKRCGRKA